MVQGVSFLGSQAEDPQDCKNSLCTALHSNRMRDQQYKLSRRCFSESKILIRRHGAGPQEAAADMECDFAFRHICGTVYVSQVCLFYCKIWMEQKVEAGISLYRKERTPAENRTAASSEGTAGFFTENVVP